MASFPVIEHLNIVEQIGPRFVPRAIADAVDALAFEQPEEALDGGVVVTVARPHSCKPLCFKLVYSSPRHALTGVRAVDRTRVHHAGTEHFASAEKRMFNADVLQPVLLAG